MAGLAPASTGSQDPDLDSFDLTAKNLNEMETVGVAPTTRCLQGSIATTAHAPPPIQCSVNSNRYSVHHGVPRRALNAGY